MSSRSSSLPTPLMYSDSMPETTGGGGSNSPLPEQKQNPQQQSAQRTAKAGGYSDQDEVRVNYLTGDVNNLLDVKF